MAQHKTKPSSRYALYRAAFPAASGPRSRSVPAQNVAGHPCLKKKKKGEEERIDNTQRLALATCSTGWCDINSNSRLWRNILVPPDRHPSGRNSSVWTKVEPDDEIKKLNQTNRLKSLGLISREERMQPFCRKTSQSAKAVSHVPCDVESKETN